MDNLQARSFAEPPKQAPDGQRVALPMSAQEEDAGQAPVEDQAQEVADAPASETHSSAQTPIPQINTSNGTTPPIPDSSTPSQPPTPRRRTDSVSTVATNVTTQSSTRSSLVFISKALEDIAASKDARSNKKLGQSVQRALAAVKSDGDPAQINPEILFEPLHLASQARTVPVVTTALDCIGKLISYSYFVIPADAQSAPPDAPPLIERAIDTICECFPLEGTHAEIELQIVKSLLAAILNDKIIVHGAGLLKAVRATYNVFLYSKSSINQQMAQGALTQMVGTVFERLKGRLSAKDARTNLSRISLEDASGSEETPAETSSSTIAVDGSDINGGDGQVDAGAEEGSSAVPSDVPVEKTGPKLTLQSFENTKDFDDKNIQDNAPTLVTRVKGRRTPVRNLSGNILTSHQDGLETTDEDEEDDIFIKDAFLVFRSMCKLSTSMRGLPKDGVLDVRSQSMRSKLLSLHLIHAIISNNVEVFISPHATIKGNDNAEPKSFVEAIKHYLCLTLVRNGASAVKQVFEVSCEIFWLMTKHLRVMLKKDIEVFLKEMYLAILDKRSAPVFQKQYILTILGRLAEDPRALVEIYLNYDCDRTALDNMFQRIIEHLSRISSTPVPITALQQQAYQDYCAKHGDSKSRWQSRGMLPPPLTTTSMHAEQSVDHGFPPEYSMKQESLECLVEILRSLVSWAQQNIAETLADRDPDSRSSIDDLRQSMETRNSINGLPQAAGAEVSSGTGTPLAEDDPSELERAKRHKTALTAAIKQFNFKPKRGIKTLVKEGFIPSDSPEDIARFFLGNELIDKKALGEYLGEGDEENIKIMHAFVDAMDFTKTRFVDALRRFLQSFRLPGEAQKIDRFMLKFAERYIAGNPNAFANADTAYVLAYSVIMLNTDQHSSKLKGRRMTPEDFIKNNRGINDNADLPDDYLRGIFDEIAHNEIVLETEQETAANLGIAAQPAGGLASNISQRIATVGRDLQREAYVQASEEMANRTEQMYKTLLRAQRRGASRTAVSKFIPATSFKHVGPMFDVTWMPFLTALSGEAQSTHNLETVKLCMEGQKLAIRIACLFDLENPRQAFVASLARFTNLYNLSEMKAKNVEALKVLLEVAQNEGNFLKEAWRDILTCISQLDRFQLISTGVDQEAVPDVLRTHVQSRTPQSRKSLNVPSRPRPRGSNSTINYQSEIAEESRSTDMIRAVDRIFTNTANLSGEAIVYFVKALTQVSWQEIQSSGQSESPRTYSLQKLVEISGYNMTRVRFEWTNIWQVLGEHFNQVGCHTNTTVVYFALNSLRQLSMRFMEIEELPGFKFQKDFLKPFEHIINNTSIVQVKDMVLRCLIQMIQARGENIRSGWRTMFGVFTVAAREPYENIVNLAFENVNQVYNTRFGVVISQGAFADLIVCLTQFSKNQKFQKKSLQAIEMLKSSVPKMLRTPECPLSSRVHEANGRARMEESQSQGLPRQPSRQSEEEQFWFPVLFAFHDVLMTGEDLEVRSRALNYLFDILTRYGGDFPREFWDTLWRQLLFPIFMVLKDKSEMGKVLNHEELSVWLSTTMIQALRNMISLFTHFFDSLECMLDRFLNLLALCICQENDTLARIGSNCLQQLILQNVQRFTPEHWYQIVNAFVDLFTKTEATALFSAAMSSSSQPPTTNGTKQLRGPTADTQSITDLSVTNTPTEELNDPSENALGINGLPPPHRTPSITPDSASTLSGSTTDTPTASSSTPPHLPPSTPAKRPSTASTTLEDYASTPGQPTQQTPVPVTAARRRFFNQIITKCVLQLLMIETVHELFTNDAVYACIPSPELLRLMQLLRKSYLFAKRFNADRELRARLFREGFMRSPPNLLKQESGAAGVFVGILFRMVGDTAEEKVRNREETEKALVPLTVEIVEGFVGLDEESQQRNIVTWRPTVVDVVDGWAAFPDEVFARHVQEFAPLVVGLLGREMGGELQRAVQGLVARVFETGLGIEIGRVEGPVGTAGVQSPRSSVFGSRRGSRVTR
ncbi:guanine nucleotide exchange protein for ADP-robosylation factor [Coniosporium apollinis]|uniref:Guanine nucleotide exchange protein for ADP-robosylation factor n=1 Tax=Coniosporium apollinis TaxID=61459 RepID=A0ABQ9NJX1_9PEZI|nr:guanine nucleotide exchange protein for ADP-robosylation factor [Coniosporium apollinis]